MAVSSVLTLIISRDLLNVKLIFIVHLLVTYSTKLCLSC